MDYTQQGVLAAQVRVHERLRRLPRRAGHRARPRLAPLVRRAPGPPEAGRAVEDDALVPGRHGVVEFTPTELDTFISGYPTEVVSGRLRQAVAALQKPKPQEHGLA